MKIIASDYNTNRYSNLKNNKYGYTLPVKTTAPAYDSFVRTSNSAQNDVSFNGLLSRFKPKFPPAVPADIDKDITTLTQKEIEELKSQVVLEINELLLSKGCTPEKEERMKKLLNSDYMSYKTKYFSLRDKKEKVLNLCDYIKNEPKNLNKKLFEQFIIKSVDEFTENVPCPGVEINNKTLKELLHKYLSLEEGTPEANDILSTSRLAARYQLQDFDYNSYLLECIKNDKSDMYERILYSGKISLSRNISKDSDRIIFDEILHSDNPVIKDSVGLETLKYNLNSDIMKSYLSVPENRTVDTISKWLPLYTDGSYCRYSGGKSNFGKKFLSLFSEHLSYDEKAEFIDTLFKKIKQDDKNFNNYYYLLLSLGYKVEEYFSFPQGQFDKIGEANAFNTSFLKNEGVLFKDVYNDASTSTDNKERQHCSLETDCTLTEEPPEEANDEDNIKTLMNTEVFNLDDFEKIYKEIDNVSEHSKENPNIVKFTLNNLPNIFVTPENEEQYKNIIESLKLFNVDFNETDHLGNNLAHLAIIAENPYLTDLAINKNVPFDKKNNNGDTALDLIDKYNSNPKVTEILKTLRINCPELLDFAKNDITSGIKIIIEDKFTDINSKNQDTLDTPWTVAAKNNSADVMKLLASHPELDKNAVNKDGDNAGILAAQEGNIEVLKLLNEFEDFDINYINPATNDSVFTTAKDARTLDEIMKNKNADPNVRLEGKAPAIFRNLEKSHERCTYKSSAIEHLERFEALCKYKKTDLSLTYGSKNIIQHMHQTIRYLKNYGIDDYQKYPKNLLTVIRNKYFESVKDMVEKEGILSLDKIKEFIDYPESETYINDPLNEHKETIGFFLADIGINRKNVSQFLEIIQSLQDKGYNFKKKNSIGQTLLGKSKDAENDFLVEYIQKKVLKNNENK